MSHFVGCSGTKGTSNLYGQTNILLGASYPHSEASSPSGPNTGAGRTPTSFGRGGWGFANMSLMTLSCGSTSLRFPLSSFTNHLIWRCWAKTSCFSVSGFMTASDSVGLDHRQRVTEDKEFRRVVEVLQNLPGLDCQACRMGVASG